MDMGFVIIELPITNQEGFDFADFDKELYQSEKGITLNGNPISVTKNDSTITVVYDGNLKNRNRQGSFSVPRL
jgi:hypothetical protein